MAEREYEVKTIMVVLDCDKCGGEMKATGEAYMTCPPKYFHICESCGHNTNVSGKTYPYVKQVEI